MSDGYEDYRNEIPTALQRELRGLGEIRWTARARYQTRVKWGSCFPGERGSLNRPSCVQ